MFILLNISSIIASISNGIMDNIDFHGTDRFRPMKDFWHLLKYVFMAGLLSIGFCIGKINWNIYYLIIYIGVFIGCKYIWDYFFYNHTETFEQIDETFNITTGIPWLDKLLGFDK